MDPLSIKLTQDLRDLIDNIGEVVHIIAPNLLHYSYILEWSKKYPEAEL